MLSGENEATASRIAAEVGIEEMLAELLLAKQSDEGLPPRP